MSQASAKLWIRETLATTGSQKQLQKHFSSTFSLCLYPGPTWVLHDSEAMN